MSALTRTPDVLVLSPHRDDAAFSCGLLLTQLLAAGASATIVNVCTVSDYAPYLASDGTVRTAQVTRVRAEEDDRFVEGLLRVSRASSEQVDLFDLGYKDAPLRRGIEAERTVEAAQLDSEEVHRLASDLRALPPAKVVLLPLAIGGHVDHLLVREAALNVFTAKCTLGYEDLPYACRSAAGIRALALVGQSSEIWQSPAIEREGLKRELAAFYPSQVLIDVCDEMERYAQKLGGRERFHADAEAIYVVKALLAAKGPMS